MARGAHAVEPGAAAAWRRTTVAAARDDTAAAATRSCVVIAPHPDDETLGCGALIARKRAAGTAVTVVIVADGRYAQPGSRTIDPATLARIRAAEALAAGAALGVAADDVVQLGHEDTEVTAREAVVEAQVAEVLEDRRPAEVLVVSGLDHHVDHRSVNRAAHRAVQRQAGDAVVREYPVWSWIDGPWLDQRSRHPVGRAAHLVGQPVQALLGGRAATVATSGYLDAKRAALAAHASQTSPYTSEPGWAVMDDDLLRPFLGPVEVFLSPLTSRRYRTC
jgi:LmbE family N-acetylglucosaminyl deacetylase